MVELRVVVSGGHAGYDEPVARHSYKYIRNKKALNIGGHCYCFNNGYFATAVTETKKNYWLQSTVTEA
jgi:hypothetical protein